MYEHGKREFECERNRKSEQRGHIVVDSKEKLVPIRPICDALGVDPKAQRNRIERDPILGSVEVMTTSTGADGKSYEMLCLPLEFIFGWLFGIDQERVSPESYEAVVRYKRDCYHALYLYFSDPQTFMEEKQQLIAKEEEVNAVAQQNFLEAKKLLNESNLRMQKAREYTMEEWKENKRQMSIDF